MSTISETCACGASFTTITDYASESRKSAEEWRENHKHAEAVGICGDMPEWRGPDTFPRPYCVLKADHVGKHSDGEGGHWGRIERPKPRPRIPLARRRA